MKTRIYVSGQISGNMRLSGKIGGEISRGMFNSFYHSFDSKKEAVKALSVAYRELLKEEPEFKSGIKYSRGIVLRYDASSARIIRNNNE